MLLRNHGIVICGETIEEALMLANGAIKACKYQVKYFDHFMVMNLKLRQKEKKTV